MKRIIFLALFISSCATTPGSKLAKNLCQDFNRGSDFQYTADYAQDFQKALNVTQMQQVFHDLKERYGACEIISEAQKTQNLELINLRTKNQKELTFKLVSQNQEITGLWFVGEKLPPVTFQSYEDMQESFESEYSDSRLYIATPTKTYVALDEEKRTALGSVFKIFILDALQKEVDEKKLSYEQQLKISNHQKSFPSGVMQDEKEGSEFPISKYAEEMIRISDNTATDHLHNLLGRTKIERNIRERGLSQTFGWSRPFLSTMEFFKARAFFKPEHYKGYAGGSRTTRLKLLQQLEKKSYEESLQKLSNWTEPRNPYDAGWYSTPKEVCSLFFKFYEEKKPQVLKSLSLNTPFIEKDTFPVVLYKGGSEPGVLQMAYLIELNKEPLCLYAGVTNSKTGVDESYFFEKMKGIMNFLKDQKSPQE